MRRQVLGLAAALSLSLVPATQAVSSPTATRTTSCTAHDVVVWLQAPGDPAAGSIYYTLGVTNLSGRPCALRGFPGVSAVDLAGRQIGTPASRDQRTPRRVGLAPGGTAHVVLKVNNTGVFPASACRPVTAAGLRVYLPNDTASSVVPLPFGACSKSGRAYLHVAPVTP